LPDKLPPQLRKAGILESRSSVSVTHSRRFGGLGRRAWQRWLSRIRVYNAPVRA
jgi:hypothetical protein